jgi:two-component sensor histidine kinase
MRVTAGSPTSPSRLVRAFRRLRAVRRLPLWARYLCTLGLVAVAAAVRYAFSGELRGFPFLLFFPAVIVAGVLFNRGAGVLAAVASAVLAVWFMPPEGSFALTRDAIVPLLLFALVGLFTALTVEALQEAVAETIEREARLTEAMDALALSERRKDLLLLELSHRIRNDLGALAGLLHLQARAAPEAAHPLKAAADRVRVLGRVHSRLGQSGDKVVIDAKDFLTELGADLENSRLAEISAVHLVVEAVPAPLPLETATALGLIVNELVTNSVKYAFPDGMGTISIDFRRVEDRYVLTVADNGVGLQDEVRGGGLGTTIVHSLASQLRGSFERRRGSPGTVATLTMPVPENTEGFGPPLDLVAEAEAAGPSHAKPSTPVPGERVG